MVEEWRIVPDGWNYEVSNLGRVRRTTDCHSWKAGRFLKPYGAGRSGDTYPTVRLFQDEQVLQIRVHRLVVWAFWDIHPKDRTGEVNHLDGNKWNSRIDNFEWTTASGNQIHAIRIGLRIPSRGTANGCAKLTPDNIAEIRELAKAGVKQKEIGERFGVTQANISIILVGKGWRHI